MLRAEVKRSIGLSTLPNFLHVMNYVRVANIFSDFPRILLGIPPIFENFKEKCSKTVL